MTLVNFPASYPQYNSFGTIFSDRLASPKQKGPCLLFDWNRVTRTTLKPIH
jgi:hypothetical protein